MGLLELTQRSPARSQSGDPLPMREHAPHHEQHSLGTLRWAESRFLSLQLPLASAFNSPSAAALFETPYRVYNRISL